MKYYGLYNHKIIRYHTNCSHSLYHPSPGQIIGNFFETKKKKRQAGNMWSHRINDRLKDGSYDTS